MKLRLVGILFAFVPVLAWSDAKLSLNKASFAPAETIQVRYSTGGLTKENAWVGVRHPSITKLPSG